MATETISVREQALSYISDPRFHQEFLLPATADSAAITVSYADVGFKPKSSNDNCNIPTVLFISGMFGTRYIGATLDPIARKYGVRVLVVDRPGMGSSTDVPLLHRISTWIRTVHLLLAHLNVLHVALIAHSAGMIYLLNILHHYRDILHPERPFVAFVAPWVDPVHSKVATWQIAQYIPAQAFSIWHYIPRIFVVDAAPLVASSGTMITKATNLFSFSTGNSNNQEVTSQERDRQKLASDYGLSQDLQIELGQLKTKRIFQESTVGANSEALLCLRKGEGQSWGECDDYSVFTTAFVGSERQKRQSDLNLTDLPKLKIRAYFAESDIMIGTGGQKYVEECWGIQGNAYSDVIDFESVTVTDTDHDSIVQSIEVLENLFSNVRGGAEH